MAGTPPIIIGKNPDWNNPDPATPAVKALISPFTHIMLPGLLTSPVIGLICSPPIGNWNQKKVFMIWCNPNGNNKRFKNPYKAVPGMATAGFVG
jgi:hypothetical protein